jgi:hypothetical protein
MGWPNRLLQRRTLQNPDWLQSLNASSLNFNNLCLAAAILTGDQMSQS